MCGIFGYVGQKGLENADAILEKMGLAVQHRGPDDRGRWIEEGVGLGHQRLAILDLSERGQQPMLSASTRWCVVFNGEIFNFQQLRQQLEQLGCRFQGDSDTEVLAHGFDTWGVEKTITQCVGMFAIGAWDRKEKEFFLVRDRLGIKPLYWSPLPSGRLLFASELHAMREFPDFHPKLSLPSLGSYLHYGYVSDTHSIYQNVFKLAPGHYLRWKPGQDVSIQTFWSSLEVASATQQSIGVEEALDRLDAIIREAVRIRMIADVPLGAFLSGGLDSSLVVSYMAQLSQRPIETFCVRFDESDYDESRYARLVSEHLQTNHEEIHVKPAQLLDIVPDIPKLCDEPLADSSLIPTSVLCRETRKRVTVALSGDGGDELFGGYTRYRLVPMLWKKLRHIPKPMRHQSAFMLNHFPKRTADRLSRILQKDFRSMGARGQGADMTRKLATLITSTSSEDLFRRVVSHWPQPERLLLSGDKGLPDLFDQPSLWPESRSFTEKMLYWDQKTFLPDSVLTKVDRASMAHSLEVRVPLLDHRIFEFAWSLPLEVRLPPGGRPKELMLQLAERKLPKGFFDRPKQGFSLPLGDWMRKELRPLMEECLNPSYLQSQGLFHARAIEKKWKEHLSGRINWHYPLWNIAVFQTWMKYHGHN